QGPAGHVTDDDARPLGHAVEIGVARLPAPADARPGREDAHAARPGGNRARHDVAVAAGPVQHSVAVVAVVPERDDRVDLAMHLAWKRMEDIAHLRGGL